MAKKTESKASESPNMDVPAPGPEAADTPQAEAVASPNRWRLTASDGTVHESAAEDVRDAIRELNSSGERKGRVYTYKQLTIEEL